MAASHPAARGHQRVVVDRRWFLVSLGAAAFLVVIVAGYGLGWSWTGFRANDTLWDWLNLVLLPVALALTPLWFVSRHRHRRDWSLAGAVVVAGFVVVLVGGYALGWRWTGFQGNTLWDWLKLFLVPFAVPVLIAGVSSKRDQGGEGTREVPALEADLRMTDRDLSVPVDRVADAPRDGTDRRS